MSWPIKVTVASVCVAMLWHSYQAFLSVKHEWQHECAERCQCPGEPAE